MGRHLDGECRVIFVTILEELRETLQTFAAQNRTSEWVNGRGLKYGIMSTRQELDAINSDRPIYINAYDGHTSWANTKALAALFRLRHIKNAGATLVLGSDWTVAPYDPMINIFAALNRKKWSPGDPDKRLTLDECILGYTCDAAYAEFQEYQKGQIKEGYLADMVLFSHDLFELKPEDIRMAKPAMTMVDGKIVYEADA